MTSMKSPDFYCEINISESEFNELCGITWNIEIFRSTYSRSIKGILIIPEGYRYSTKRNCIAWLWINSPIAKVSKDSKITVRLIGAYDVSEYKIGISLMQKLRKTIYPVNLTESNSRAEPS